MHSEDNAKEEVSVKRLANKPNISDPSSRHTSKVKHAATETPANVNLAEVWSKAMEDGTMVVNTSKVKKVMVVRHHVYPVQTVEEPSSHGDVFLTGSGQPHRMHPGGWGVNFGFFGKFLVDFRPFSAVFAAIWGRGSLRLSILYLPYPHNFSPNL